MFADNLISLRKLHNLSQEELAEKINVSRQTLSKYETGESLPDIEKCKALAEVFDVSIDDLINYEAASADDLRGSTSSGLSRSVIRDRSLFLQKPEKYSISNQVITLSSLVTKDKDWH